VWAPATAESKRCGPGFARQGRHGRTATAIGDLDMDSSYAHTMCAVRR
jgi:hypothetical protein